MLSEINKKESEVDTLIYKVSHDIKGPLNSIIGLTNVALSEITEEKSTLYFNKIKKSAEKLHLFVNELLNVTKITIKDAEKEKINFQEIINDILISLQYLPNFKKIDISINIQQYSDFYSDTLMIYSILQNIIENSIKYWDEGKAYSFLKIKILTNEDNTKLELEDNGIGIEENFKERIFEMFARGTEKSSGNGLGLFIVKKSVEKLNGTINIQSKYGNGTITTLIFQH